MRRPGARLRAIASRLCSAQTLERVIDPLIADLQLEHADATRQRGAWKGRWIRLVAAVALFKVIVLCGGRAMMPLRDARADEHRALVRTIGFSAASMSVLATLLVMVVWRNTPGGTHALQALMVAYLIPQALPLAIPIGLTIGILFGFRGHVPSASSTRVVLTTAVSSSMISFAVLVWLMPSANQAYRQSVAESQGITLGHLRMGVNEMTLSELNNQIDTERRNSTAEPRFVRNLTFSYHQRWSLASATLLLALFALGVLAHRPPSRWILGMAVIGACSAYYASIMLGRSVALDGVVPAFVGAWLPNVVIGLLSMKLFERAWHHRDPIAT